MQRTIHQGRRPFKCDQPACTASFVQRFDLETHRSSVHDKRKDHRCEQCGRSFSQRSNLLTHVRITHDDCLTCADCDQQFKTRANLNQHLAVHSPVATETVTTDTSAHSDE